MITLSLSGFCLNRTVLGVDLSRANLTDANLLGANWSSIIREGTLFCNTTMPDGSIYSDPSRVIKVEELLQRYANGERKFYDVVIYPSCQPRRS
ncbi:hypothetical protein [Nostoc sp.]|uniref:hypothetical protein n=1 Tax=Nostoc sp. TaxID=1180 RepID=UPI002FF91025